MNEFLISGRLLTWQAAAWNCSNAIEKMKIELLNSIYYFKSNYLYIYHKYDHFALPSIDHMWQYISSKKHPYTYYEYEKTIRDWQHYMITR